MRSFGLLFIYSIILSGSALGQSRAGNYEIGAGAGTFVYEGDLARYAAGSFRTQKIGINLFINRKLGYAFSLRTNLAIGKLKGDDSKFSSPDYRQERNFLFKSPVAEISELLVWSPFGNDDEKVIAPYLMGGLGISFVHIRRDWSRFNAEYFASAPAVTEGLAVDQQHSLPRALLVVPAGIGVRHSISRRFSAYAEASYRFTFTDYLDGFSHAANPSKDDHYSNYSVGLVYKLGRKNKLDCPIIHD